MLFIWINFKNVCFLIINLENIFSSTTKSIINFLPLLWESDSKDKSIKRISECVWEESRSEKAKLKYEFVDFNQQNSLYLFDKENKVFININDKDYSQFQMENGKILINSANI